MFIGLIVLHCCAVWNGLLHHWFEHISALQCWLMWLNGLSELHLLHEGLFFVFCCLMCLAGVSELLVVLVGLLFDSLFALFVACSCMLVGFNVLHCCAVWNSLLHHVFVHFTAVHVVCVCLVGLSDLHVVQRAVVGLLVCCFVLFCLLFLV